MMRIRVLYSQKMDAVLNKECAPICRFAVQILTLDTIHKVYKIVENIFITIIVSSIKCSHFRSDRTSIVSVLARARARMRRRVDGYECVMYYSESERGKFR